MNLSDAKPAKDFAIQFGVKAVVYGRPGSGKTPICVETAPQPFLLASEPGMLTLRRSNCPTYPAFTAAKIDEFFLWWFSSHESRQFNTLIWDSASQGMEAYVDFELSKGNKSGGDAHGLKAYGNAARATMKHLSGLYFQQQKHVVLITKLNVADMNGGQYRRPYFPGKDLNIRVPHLFDLVMELGMFNVPGVMPSPTRAFSTAETFDAMGRDRSGTLGVFEPPNLATIFAKCLA